MHHTHTTHTDNTHTHAHTPTVLRVVSLFIIIFLQYIMLTYLGSLVVYSINYYNSISLSKVLYIILKPYGGSTRHDINYFRYIDQ